VQEKKGRKTTGIKKPSQRYRVKTTGRKTPNRKKAQVPKGKKGKREKGFGNTVPPKGTLINRKKKVPGWEEKN